MTLKTYIAVAALLSAAATPAFAAEHKGSSTFNWTYAPQSVPLSDSVSSTVGVVHGLTMLADGTRFGTLCTDVDAPNGTSNGVCVHTDADGDKMMIDWSCANEAQVPAGALFACKGPTTITGGTGKYAHASGKGIDVITGVSVLSDGTVVGITTEEYDFDY